MWRELGACGPVLHREGMCLVQSARAGGGDGAPQGARGRPEGGGSLHSEQAKRVKSRRRPDAQAPHVSCTEVYETGGEDRAESFVTEGALGGASGAPRLASPGAGAPASPRSASRALGARGQLPLLPHFLPRPTSFLKEAERLLPELADGGGEDTSLPAIRLQVEGRERASEGELSAGRLRHPWAAPWAAAVTR